MGLFGIITQRSVESKLPEMARNITDRCIESVWRKVGHRAPALNPNQARGYIRVRAAMIVHREVEQLLGERPGLRANARTRLVEMSIESVIQRVQKMSHSLQAAAPAARHVA